MKTTFRLICALLVTAIAASFSACKKTEAPAGQKVQLQTPDGMKVLAAGASEMTIGWNAVENALYYDIYLDDDVNPFRSIDNKLKIKGLTPLTNYRVKLVAVPHSRSEYTVSTPSETFRFTTADKDKLPAPVLELIITERAGAKDSLAIIWTSIENAGSYRLSVNGGPETEVTDTSAGLAGLLPNRTYSAKVCAVPSKEKTVMYNVSDWTEKSVTTEKAPLATPDGINLVQAGPFDATIAWNAVANAEYYELFLNGSQTAIKANDNKCTLDGLQEETQYQIRIAAVPAEASDYRKSELSATFKFKTTADTQPLDTPEIDVTLVQRGYIKDSLHVTWAAVEGAGSYKVVVNNGEEMIVEELSYGLGNLKANTEYAVKVCAVPDEAHAKDKRDSNWAIKSVTTPAFRKNETEPMEREGGEW